MQLLSRVSLSQLEARMHNCTEIKRLSLPASLSLSFYFIYIYIHIHTLPGCVTLWIYARMNNARGRERRDTFMALSHGARVCTLCVYREAETDRCWSFLVGSKKGVARRPFFFPRLHSRARKKNGGYVRSIKGR